MTQRVPGSGSKGGVAELLTALVELVAAWSSPALQGRIAHGLDLDLSESDVRSLYMIGRFGGCAQPAQLAAQLYITRPTMSKSLARLEAAGFITRTRAVHDGRASDVSLTNAGDDAYQRLVTAGIEMVRNALNETESADVDSMTRFARALQNSNIEQHD